MKEIGGRCAGKQVTLSGAQSQVMHFGPFEPGDVITGFRILGSQPAPSNGPNVITWDVAAKTSTGDPVDSTAVFATGRSLFRGVSLPLPQYPVDVLADLTPDQSAFGVNVDVPILWVADDKERWLMLQFTSDGAGDDTTIAVFPRVVRLRD